LCTPPEALGWLLPARVCRALVAHPYCPGVGLLGLLVEAEVAGLPVEASWRREAATSIAMKLHQGRCFGLPPLLWNAGDPTDMSTFDFLCAKSRELPFTRKFARGLALR